MTSCTAARWRARCSTRSRATPPGRWQTWRRCAQPSLADLQRFLTSHAEGLARDIEAGINLLSDRWESLLPMIRQLSDRRMWHDALGHGSWEECVKVRFGTALGRWQQIGVLEDRVLELTTGDEAMSNRMAAVIAGVSEGKVRLIKAKADVAPGTSRGADGRKRKSRRKRAADDWAPGLSESQRNILCRIGWQTDHRISCGPGGTYLRGAATVTIKALAAKGLITFTGIYHNLTDAGRKMFAAAPAAVIEEAVGGADAMAELLKRAAPKADDEAAETAQEPAGNQVAPPATDEPTVLETPVQDRTDPPEQVLTDRQRELLRNLSGTSDWVPASTLGAANGISQIADHLPGLVEKTGGGGTDWKSPLQVRLTEAGRQRCEQLWPPPPEPVPLADDEVREMLHRYLEDLTDSQQLADFAQEHLGGNRLFDDPWPVVVARCWPAEPIEVRVSGMVVGWLSFTPAPVDHDDAPRHVAAESPHDVAEPPTATVRREQPKRLPRSKRRGGSSA